MQYDAWVQFSLLLNCQRLISTILPNLGLLTPLYPNTPEIVEPVDSSVQNGFHPFQQDLKG